METRCFPLLLDGPISVVPVHVIFQARAQYAYVSRPIPRFKAVAEYLLRADPEQKQKEGYDVYNRKVQPVLSTRNRKSTIQHSPPPFKSYLPWSQLALKFLDGNVPSLL